MITQTSGRRVAVVQAYAYAKYLGTLNLKFDDEGELEEASGNPRLLDATISQGKNRIVQIVFMLNVVLTSYSSRTHLGCAYFNFSEVFNEQADD